MNCPYKIVIKRINVENVKANDENPGYQLRQLDSQI